MRLLRSAAGVLLLDMLALGLSAWAQTGCPPGFSMKPVPAITCGKGNHSALCEHGTRPVQQCQEDAAPYYLLPDATLTPGAVNPLIVADPSGKPHMIPMRERGREAQVEANICAKDFRTKPFRHTTESTKKQVCREYGVTDCPKEGAKELDHDVPLELGGLDVPSDLWVQFAPAFHVKDFKVEDKLPGLVCSGRISLHDAQECIVHNWVACMATVNKLEK